MRQLKIIGIATSMSTYKHTGNTILKSVHQAYSKCIITPFSLFIKPTFQSSTLKRNEQTRKILQISHSIIPSLFQNQDYATIIEFLRQISIIFVSYLDSSSKEESRRVLNRIVEIVLQLQQKVTSLEEESLLDTLKLLSENIDKINDTTLILNFDDLYLRCLLRFKREESVDYIKALAKMMEDCISANQAQKGIRAYDEIKKRRISMDAPLKIEIQINCAILQLMLGRFLGAQYNYETALKLCRQSNNSKEVQSYQIIILQCLGDLAKKGGKYEDAINYYKLSLTSSQDYFEKANVNTAIVLYKLAQSQFILHRYDQALYNFKKVEEMTSRQANIGEQFEYEKQLILMIAESYLQTNHVQASIDYFNDYLSIVEKTIITDEKSYIQSLLSLGHLYSRIENKQKGQECIDKIARFYDRYEDQEGSEEDKRKY